MKLSHKTYKLIQDALNEDIGTGDVTTNSSVPVDYKSKAVITAKEDIHLCGINIAKKVFFELDENITFEPFFKDGDIVKSGENIAKVNGNTRALLTSERTALNFLQRLSGVSTNTAGYVHLLKDYKAKVIDTRKTTPGYRNLEKYAVICGGGENHRFGLYDMVLIKDNHIAACGGINKCILAVRKSIGEKIKVEVEVKNLQELVEALSCDPDIILLDNMSIDELNKAVEANDGKVLLEASGGITKETIVSVAKTGVDFISCGALTHSARSVDISMNFVGD